ncbi:hypothetical protein GCM10010326_50430 [Streptomyces xanthochromogenes]|uniref:Uncharacterized protein n=1 Tax=Streptomyces xanthochromogenes TaxID=67384 RepID=A0ABQ3AHI4_9ACTN|nr:hypothetical protein GCM10010326_50430 [Streptomyces xanthochromogenes]
MPSLITGLHLSGSGRSAPGSHLEAYPRPWDAAVGRSGPADTRPCRPGVGAGPGPPAPGTVSREGAGAGTKGAVGKSRVA